MSDSAGTSDTTTPFGPEDPTVPDPTVPDPAVPDPIPDPFPGDTPDPEPQPEPGMPGGTVGGPDPGGDSLYDPGAEPVTEETGSAPQVDPGAQRDSDYGAREDALGQRVEPLPDDARHEG